MLFEILNNMIVYTRLEQDAKLSFASVLLLLFSISYRNMHTCLSKTMFKLQMKDCK